MTEFLATFSIIVGIGLLFTILALKLRMPPALGLLLAGMLVGPYALGLIDGVGVLGENFEILQHVGEIGAILLLFTLGIEFSISKLLKGGLRIFLVFISKIAIVFSIGYVAMIVAGFEILVALAVGVIVSITSTAVFIKILAQQGLDKRKEVPLLIGVLILEDLYAVLALTFFSQLDTGSQISMAQLFGQFALAGTILVVVYVILSKTLKKIVQYFIPYQGGENTAFLAIVLCFGLAAFADYIGLAATAGAFLAGSIVASLPNSKHFEESIQPFTLIFVSLFFLAIGLQVNFMAILSAWPLLLGLLTITIIGHFLGISLPSFFFSGMNGRSAIFAGIAMIPVGEFSLLIAQQANNLGTDLVSVTAGVIFGSSFIMAILLPHHGAISNSLSRFTPLTVRSLLSYTSYRFATGLSAFEPGGKIYDEFKTKRRNIIRDGLALLAVCGFILIERQFGNQIIQVLNLPQESSLFTLFILRIVLIVLAAGVFILMLKHLRDLLNLVSHELLDDPKTEKKAEGLAIRRYLYSIILGFAGIVAIPLIIDFLHLPGVYYALIALPIFFSIINFWSANNLFANVAKGKVKKANIAKLIRNRKKLLKNDILIGNQEYLEGEK